MNNITSISQVLFIAEGSFLTLKYSMLSVFLGLFLGVILAFAKQSKYRIISALAHIYTSLFRGTPLIVQLSIVYFALPDLIGMDISVFVAGITAFSLNSAAYISEIIKAGINNVEKGQIESAILLNIPKYYIAKDIIMPQAVRSILPSLTNEMINMLKESALISIFGELDLMYRANIIAFEGYDFITPMFIVAGCYYILVLIFSALAILLEKRLKL
ncbi:MAG: amino acid ABC transporter permease [Rickettsiaceae bacterium]|nr:amino acid ABC transporter permease [Rickettsiaceae bacterium]